MERKHNEFGRDLLGFRNDINELADSLFGVKQKGHKLRPHKRKLFR